MQAGIRQATVPGLDDLRNRCRKRSSAAVASPAVPLFQASPGTRDILPPDAARWRALVDVFAQVVEVAAYGLIIPPMFEDLGVFPRIGEATDIVRKEMYDFEDKGGRHLALRPEQTASVVRAFVEHRPPTPWKVWYAAPNFRHEKAQKGRYRQFHQVGVEVLGVEDPDLDVEVIALAWRFYAQLGLRQVHAAAELARRRRRPRSLRRHRSATYLEDHRVELSDEAQATLERNPLRVLDSKRPQDRAVVAEAPLLFDHLSPEAAAHFDGVQDGPARPSASRSRSRPQLVRGLDYYSRTTFEFAGEALDAAQNAVGGGGRYDGLVEELGGPPTPGIGFALGVERTLLACDAEEVFPPPDPAVDVFVVDTTGGAEALELTADLRAAGVRADRAFEQPVDEEPDEGGRPQRRGRSPLLDRQRRAGRRHGDRPVAAGRGRSGTGRRGRTSSTS